ncbi:hypothetical protein ARMSODRAFT_983249 [Armillaria solidipes]|uniref:Uncharacterized protein n=1 Tax=Armillaria solidipes TaxID=1076256 RepID=A0A2H3AWC6_9AGAR|nr:hypothetical protein ARMSODRAFT_983249 [Armillaria solidipes]
MTTYLDLKPGAEAAKQIIKLFDRAKERLGRYLEELPSEKGGWGTMDGPAGMQLADGVCGNISMTGGAVHLYRLVVGILSRLLKTYSTFRLYTRTPCLSIYDNVVHTRHGDIHTKHVHTANGWTSHLLALMREKIVPMLWTYDSTARRNRLG